MIAFFVMLLAACAFAEVISLRHALDGIEYDCRISEPIAEPDAPLELITAVTNRRRRFVPFLRLVEDVPGTMRTDGALETLSATDDRGGLRSSVYFMPRQRLTRRTAFSMPARGRYLFMGAELGGGDFLGLSERKSHAEAFAEVVILPKRAQDGVLDALPGGLLGDVSVNRFIHEDPMLSLGARDYTGREPMKLISWTQTARQGRLMVKNLDHTMERSATVLLNVDTSTFGKYAEGLMERCFSLTRSVCEELEAQKVAYSFFTNVRAAGGSNGEIGDGLGRAHLSPILEGLGRATYERGDSLWALIDRAVRTGDAGRTMILITPARADLKGSEIERIAERTGVEPRVFAAEEARE